MEFFMKKYIFLFLVLSSPISYSFSMQLDGKANIQFDDQTVDVTFNNCFLSNNNSNGWQNDSSRLLNGMSINNLRMNLDSFRTFSPEVKEFIRQHGVCSIENEKDGSQIRTYKYDTPCTRFFGLVWSVKPISFSERFTKENNRWIQDKHYLVEHIYLSHWCLKTKLLLGAACALGLGCLYKSSVGEKLVNGLKGLFSKSSAPLTKTVTSSVSSNSDYFHFGGY